jgi:membrane protein DedA with SNARE-associated domain
MNIIEMLNDWILVLISTAGYLGIFLAMFVEGILTPIPSELIMPFAGYLCSTGELNIVLVVLAGSLGAVAGSTVSYYLGKLLGRRFLDRFGRYFGLGPESLSRADTWFARWGSYGILIGHAVPGIRSIISFPAGIARMDVKRFVLFTFLGATIWNSVLVSAGFLLVGPFLCMGLYHVSAALERGERPRLIDAALAWRAKLDTVAVFGVVLLVLELVWARASLVVFALSFEGSMPDFEGRSAASSTRATSTSSWPGPRWAGSSRRSSSR